MLKEMLSAIANAVKEDLGIPAALRSVLEQHAETLRFDLTGKECIAAGSVPRWHEWGEGDVSQWPRRAKGEMLGWKYTKHYGYCSFHLKREDLANIGHYELNEAWACDARDVAGLSSSKSDLQVFRTLDQMVEANSREMIENIDDEGLARNLAHKEIRIVHQDRHSDYFARYLWDGRLFLINSGGSHHFAAARYIAGRLNRDLPLRGALRTYSLARAAVSTLRRDFEMFAVCDQNAAALNALHHAMEVFQATYLWHPLPRPYVDGRVLFLPKDLRRSQIVADHLLAAGLADVGAHLATLIWKQDAVSPSVHERRQPQAA